MDDFDDIIEELKRFVVEIIVNDNRHNSIATNFLETANFYYEEAVNKYKNNNRDHIIIFIYDYEKNTNINYYDNRTEIC